MSATFGPTNFSSMDSRYQYLYACSLNTSKQPTFVSANEKDVPVIAKVSDLDSWIKLSEVRLGMKIKGKDKDGDNWIVTSRIPFERFEALGALKFVKNLTITSLIQPALEKTRRDIGLDKTSKISKAILDQAGKNVIVGIVDFGCDFAHKNFKNESNKTRIHSIWDQGGQMLSDDQVSYGRIYTEADINKALRTRDPYTALGYHPGQSAHGTHVMDIAAGSGSSPGIAPKSQIIFVELGFRKVREFFEERGIEEDEKLADSVRVMEAVEYIFKQAGDKPCVVNLSLGQHSGPHDGSGLVETALDRMIAEKSNRMIVISAGNSYTDNSHFSGCVTQDSPVDIKWTIKSLSSGTNELEIWYSGNDEFKFEILQDIESKHQVSESKGQVPLGSSKHYLMPILASDGSIKENAKVAFVSHRKDRNNLDNVIHIFHDTSCDIKEGILKLRLSGIEINTEGKFHAWIDRKVVTSSIFSEGDDPNYTIGSISSGRETIVVGSYDADQQGRTPPSWFSSAGPTRDERYKPDISAPGRNVLAANSATKKPDHIKKSGTSMSAPVVTGLVARILGQAWAKDVKLTGDKIREIIFTHCRKDVIPEGEEWDSRYGYGRLDAEALNHVLALPPIHVLPSETEENIRPLKRKRASDDAQQSSNKRSQKEVDSESHLDTERDDEAQPLVSGLKKG